MLKCLFSKRLSYLTSANYTGEKPYKCKKCTYVCSQKSNLVKHQRIHTSEKPYKCKECSYACSRKYVLLKVLNISEFTQVRTVLKCLFSKRSSYLTSANYTGEKPIKCKECSYACYRKCVLVKHHRIHTGEKPYKCKVCSYACSEKCNLDNHQQIQTGEKPYK